MGSQLLICIVKLEKLYVIGACLAPPSLDCDSVTLVSDLSLVTSPV